MSVYQSIYMGPYIVAPIKTIKVEKTKRICELTVNHFAPANALYCPNCGGKIIEKTFEENKVITPWYVVTERYVDRLVYAGPNDNNILIPNQHLKGSHTHRIPADEENVYELPSDQVKHKDIQLMKEQYAEEIAYLIEQGFEVSFYYGLIISFS